jgi:quinol-cytochrome oxidoreductase complex cytochrome b subunit
LVLTWIGARPVDGTYILIGQVFSLVYFSYFFISPSVGAQWEKIMIYNKVYLLWKISF